MAFPSSPSNNQTVIVNGITYAYNSTRNTWTRQLSGVTSSSSGLDDYARVTANTTTNNIVILQGVDTSQNTRLSVVEGGLISANANTVYLNSLISTNNTRISSTDNTATAAYAKANAAFDKANTGVSTSTDDYARTTANTATNNITILQGVDTTQNTRISSTDNTATAAYAKANAAFDKANTGGSGSSSGYLANSVIIANTTGYLTNTSALLYYTSNNNLVLTGNVIAGGVRSTTSASAPSNPTVGDIWYETTTDIIYRFTNDGSNSYWLDISSATVSSNTSSSNTSSSGGGAVASGVIYENSQNVTSDYTITAGKNAMSAGPITINTGVTVTIPTGSRWVIV